MDVLKQQQDVHRLREVKQLKLLKDLFLTSPPAPIDNSPINPAVHELFYPTQTMDSGMHIAEAGSIVLLHTQSSRPSFGGPIERNV